MADQGIQQLRERLNRIEADLGEVRESLRALEASQAHAPSADESSDDDEKSDGLVATLLAWAQEGPEGGFEGVPTDASVRLDEYLYEGNRH